MSARGGAEFAKTRRHPDPSSPLISVDREKEPEIFFEYSKS